MSQDIGGEEHRDAERRMSLEERVRALCRRSTVFAAVVDRMMHDSPSLIPDDTVATTELGRHGWYSRRTLFVTGPHASGKSAVVRAALYQAEGFAHFDTGPTLRSYHQADSPGTTFGHWVGMNEARYGANFTDALLACHIGMALSLDVAEHSEGLVVIGNRSYDGVRYLSQRLAPSDTRIIYVDAPKELLYERYKAREGRQEITQEEFDEVLDADIQMGLAGLNQRADRHIANDTELISAAQQLRRYVEAWQPPVV